MQEIPSSSFSQKEIEHVCDFYEIDTVQHWEMNYRGLVNKVCEIDDKFFMTSYKEKTLDQVETIAQIANQIEESIPMAKPLKGKEGYSFAINKLPILLSPKLPGEHAVGIAHTEKYPISINFHRKLAKFFWQLQKNFSTTAPDLKKILSSESVSNVSSIPLNPSEDFSHLYEYSTGILDPEYRYPDLIHDDMERQNILSIKDNITGLVDLDSIRMGDVLYEFGHFLFNFVLCDTNADMSTIDIYINEMIVAGIINPKDIPHLYNHIFYFIISDIIEFKDLSKTATDPQHKMIDMELLIRQYESALSKANTFFKKTFSQSI